MKFETAGQVGSGFLMASAALLAQFGTTWPVVALAVIGAVLAILEMEVRRARTVLMIVIFNVVIGALAAPIVVVELALEQHKAAVMIMAFLGGYAGHDFFMTSRDAIRTRIGKMAGGRK